jgi:ABC-2 type transport system permease protein
VNRLAALLKKEWIVQIYSGGTLLLFLFFFGLCGLTFWTASVEAVRAPGPDSIVSRFFTSELFWLNLFLVCPLLSMRGFAEEWRTGSFEGLLTTPVRESELVVSKFLVAWALFLLMWIPTVNFFLTWKEITGQPLPWGAIWGGYIGVACLGAVLIAVGTFCSAFSTHPLAAAMLSLVLEGVWIAFSMAARWIPELGLNRWAQYGAPDSVMQKFASGLIDFEVLVGVITVALAFLWLATGTLHIRRWR